LCFIPNMFIKGKFKSSFSGFLWFAGLSVMFYFNVFLAGILILIGMQVLLAALFKD